MPNNVYSLSVGIALVFLICNILGTNFGPINDEQKLVAKSLLSRCTALFWNSYGAIYGMQRLACIDSVPELEKLKNIWTTIHQHNLHLLMIELFKTKNILNPTFMKNVFTKKNVQCSLRSENYLQLRKVGTTTYRIDMQYRGHVFGPQCQRKLRFQYAIGIQPTIKIIE